MQLEPEGCKQPISATIVRQRRERKKKLTRQCNLKRAWRVVKKGTMASTAAAKSTGRIGARSKFNGGHIVFDGALYAYFIARPRHATFLGAAADPRLDHIAS